MWICGCDLTIDKGRALVFPGWTIRDTYVTVASPRNSGNIKNTYTKLKQVCKNVEREREREREREGGEGRDPIRWTLNLVGAHYKTTGMTRVNWCGQSHNKIHYI